MNFKDRHGDAVRGADRVAGDGRQGATLPGADIVDAAQRLQLQRNPQPPGGAGHHLRPVHPRPARAAPQGRRHARHLPPLRHDHPARGRAPLQIISR